MKMLDFRHDNSKVRLSNTGFQWSYMDLCFISCYHTDYHYMELSFLCIEPHDTYLHGRFFKLKEISDNPPAFTINNIKLLNNKNLI